jgi:hypothetical protein
VKSMAAAEKKGRRTTKKHINLVEVRRCNEA